MGHPTTKGDEMEQKLFNAYLATMLEMCKPGSTFSVEANAQKRELADPFCSVSEIFQHVEDNPLNAFESHWRTLARRSARFPAPK